MKRNNFIFLMLSVLIFAACSKDESSNSGLLKIEYPSDYLYANANRIPGRLYISTLENPDTVVETIYTTDRKKQKVRLLTGNYRLVSERIIENENENENENESEGETEMSDTITFRILPDRTTRVMYYNGTIMVK